MNRIRCKLEINDLNKLLYIYDENLANVIYGCLGYVKLHGATNCGSGKNELD